MSNEDRNRPSSDSGQMSRRQAMVCGWAGAATASLAVLAAEKAAAAEGEITKEVENLGVPWEKAYGYAQAIKVGDTIYLSGQLSHDEAGNLVAPAPIDADGQVSDHRNMGPQMARSYANAELLLARFGATLANVVEEVLYVTDMDAAFAVAGEVRAAAYGGPPVVASTILVTPRLAFREQLIEIKLTAKV